jgi:hypothetical protein
MRRLDRALTAAAALLLGLLGFLPIANWIPGGRSIPTWENLAGGWWSGTLIVAGFAVVIAILARHLPAFRGPGVPVRLVASFAEAPGRWSAAIALVALGVYLTVAQSVFAARPLLIDEVAQVFQARIYAGGALALPAPPHPEFFSALQIVNQGGKVFSQYPPGGPAMLALGALVGAEWIVGPLFGAASVLLFSALVRRIEPRPGVTLASIMLFAFAPFIAFMSGSHMNHVTGLTWLLLGLLGLARAMDTSSPRLADGLLLGLGFGVAATIRPLDAAAFAAPAGLWFLVRALRRRAWGSLLGAGLGVAVPIAVLLYVNAGTTGSPLRFGYSAYYGPEVGLGFHRTPWGELHTPLWGLELLNIYFVRLQSYFLELPIPSLLPALAALALTWRLAPFDRYLIVAAAMLCGLYFLYWSDGFYLGPRFLYATIPMLTLWTCRALPLLEDRLGSGWARRALVPAIVIALVLGLATELPRRVREHQSRLTTMRWDADAAARRAGIRDAVVLVRESWGAQLIARMWAAGVRPNIAEQVYRRSDACALERTLDVIERRRQRDRAAEAMLQPLLVDSARLVPSPYTADPSNRFLPGSAYTEECLQRLGEDRRGVTLFLPLVLAGRDGVVYARDLHARDSLLLEGYPDRPVYLLRPPSSELGAVPGFEPLDRDSLLTSWRSGR